MTQLPAVYADHSQYAQLVAVRLGDVGDLRAFQNRLFNEYRVEMPCIDWLGTPLIRISVQGYNTKADIDASISALNHLLA